MSGHSKMVLHQGQKGAADAKRGQLFTKLAPRDPGRRARGRRRAREERRAPRRPKARDASLPKHNLERAIAKGAGNDADAFESYAAGGVAVLVEALIDNRNRTPRCATSSAATVEPRRAGLGGLELRQRRGVVLVDAERHHEDDLIVAIDAGAEDLTRDENVWEIVTAPGSLQAVRDALADV